MEGFIGWLFTGDISWLATILITLVSMFVGVCFVGDPRRPVLSAVSCGSATMVTSLVLLFGYYNILG